MTPPEQGALLQGLMTVDHQTPAFGVLELAYRRPQVQGSEPFVEGVEFDRSIAPADLLEGFEVIGAVTDPSVARVHARSVLGGVMVRSFTTSTMVSVSSATPAGAAELAGLIRRRGESSPPANTVSLRTWHIDKFPGRQSRKIEAPTWDEICRNYPRTVRQQVARVTRLERPRSNGKLILWHGAPGVGKTTAIRSLMREWAPWCQSEYISDPERFFGETRYLLKVLEENSNTGCGPRMDRPAQPDLTWRLVVAEDCDEYLRPNARNDAGAGLGRLLNLTDGLLGQGHNLLILLSTNEDLSRLHPAVIRPGRCLSTIHFHAFDRAEAAEWLDHDQGLPPTGEEWTLAELLELRGDLAPIGDDRMSVASVGQYL